LIDTPIGIAATAAARFSSARAALGQSHHSGDLLAAQGNVSGIAYVGINSKEN
jgi:hypothetical protein